MLFSNLTKKKLSERNELFQSCLKLFAHLLYHNF